MPFPTCETRRHVILIGGPDALPATLRIQLVERTETKVKLPWYGGYEHFVATSERRQMNGLELPVFTWAHRTRIAE